MWDDQTCWVIESVLANLGLEANKGVILLLVNFQMKLVKHIICHQFDI